MDVKRADVKCDRVERPVWRLGLKQDDCVRMTVTVNLSCPLDWIENHHENIPLGMSTRMFLENFD